MPLIWSEEREPNYECSYTHVVSETPLGKIYIECKGWKEDDTSCCNTPWGDFILGYNLEDAKDKVQESLDRFIDELLVNYSR